MSQLPSRIELLRALSGEFPEDPVVFTCGATSREMAHADRRPNHLYVVDSMGIVSSVLLGLSLSLEGSSVNKCVGVEGDGGMLMNLNALATIGHVKPRNLLLVVLDNESYASTGGQPTFTTELDLSKVAESCGLRTWKAENAEEFRAALASAAEVEGPGFIHAKIAPGNADVPLLLDDPALLSGGFAAWLDNRTAPQS